MSILIEPPLKKRPVIPSHRKSLDKSPTGYIFPPLHCEHVCSITRHRNDLVGKRILCLPESFTPDAPSPAALSSKLWSTKLVSAIRELKREGNPCQNLSWCPEHHHHQPSQTAYLNSIKKCNRKVISKTASSNTDFLTKSRNKSSRGSGGQQQRNSSQTSSSDKASYPTLKTKERETVSSVAGLGMLTRHQFYPYHQEGYTATKTTCESCIGIINESQRIYDVKANDQLQVGQYDIYQDTADINNFKSTRELQQYLCSLPWCIGTIRAVNNHATREYSSSLLIEFDLLDWHSRDWYEICDTTGEKAREQSEAASTCLSYQSDFKVLLVENSACCLNRHLAPTGRDKLWPGILFEPLIDKLGLFTSSSLGDVIRAVEYLEPSFDEQPICDMTAIVSELQTQITDEQSIIKIIGSSQTDLSRKFQHNESPRVHEHGNNVGPSTGYSDSASRDCSCWSPRVVFAKDRDIFKLCKASVSPADLKPLLSQQTSQTVVKSEKNFLYNSLESPSSKTSRSNQDEPVNGSFGTIVTIERSNLNSFGRFLRFFHRIHTINQSKAFDVPHPLSSDIERSSLGVETKDSAKTVAHNDLFDAIIGYPSLYQVLRNWHFDQDAQSLLGTAYTAALLVGNRVRVYRTSGTTQWYTAVIISCDIRTTLLTLIDDTVLEEHHEDPALLEIHLIDSEQLVKFFIEGYEETSRSGTVRRRVPRTNQRRLAVQPTTTSGAIINSSAAIANGIGHTNSSNSSSNSGAASNSSSGGGCNNNNNCASINAIGAISGQAATRNPAYSMNPAHGATTPTAFSSTPTGLAGGINRAAGKPHNKSLSVAHATISPSQLSNCAPSLVNSTFSSFSSSSSSSSTSSTTITGNQTTQAHHHNRHQVQLPSQQLQHHRIQSQNISRASGDAVRNGKSKGNTNLDGLTYLGEANETPFRRSNINSTKGGALQGCQRWSVEEEALAIRDKLTLEEYEWLTSGGGRNVVNKDLLDSLLEANASAGSFCYDLSTRGLLGMKICRTKSAKRDGKGFLLHRMRLAALLESPPEEAATPASNVDLLQCYTSSSTSSSLSRSTTLLDRDIGRDSNKLAVQQNTGSSKSILERHSHAISAGKLPLLPLLAPPPPPLQLPPLSQPQPLARLGTFGRPCMMAIGTSLLTPTVAQANTRTDCTRQKQ